MPSYNQIKSLPICHHTIKLNHCQNYVSLCTQLTDISMDLRKSIGTQTDFALLLASNLLPAAPLNAVFSPASLHTALALLAAASRGPTLDQALAVLGSGAKEELAALASQVVGVILADASSAGGPRLSFVNGIWVDASLKLKPSFGDLLRLAYKAHSREVDFQTKAVEVKNDVNSWAERETNSLIKELLPDGSIDHSTKLILANALYFKGAWNDKFDASKTKDFDFHLLDGNKVQVPFMTSKKKQFVSAFDGFKVLTLAYKRGEDRRQFSMYFLLPDAKDGLHSLVKQMSSEPGFLDRHIPLDDVEIGNFRIPKFKISFGFEASKNLKDLGLVLPFMGGDLTEMVESPIGENLYVSSIHHKSFIEINEEGTEAAAATAVVVKLRTLLVAGPVDFVADHPFLFLIREEKTGVVLFVGHVVDPSQAS